MPCRGSNRHPTWCCAASPFTAPCGMQSVVQKTWGICAKVVTFLSVATAFHFCAHWREVKQFHLQHTNQQHLTAYTCHSELSMSWVSLATMLQSLWCSFKVHPQSKMCFSFCSFSWMFELHCGEWCACKPPNYKTDTSFNACFLNIWF